MMRTATGTMLTVLAFAVPAWAQSAPLPVCDGLSVELRAANALVPAGTRPDFSVIVVNGTAEPVRVLALGDGRRPDLQDAYVELRVEQDGRPVEVRTLISDPGPLLDDDYIRLEPGDRLEIHRLNYRRMLETLPVGDFTAHVVFWRDPLRLDTRCRSSEAAFAVE